VKNDVPNIALNRTAYGSRLALPLGSDSTTNGEINGLFQYLALDHCSNFSSSGIFANDHRDS